MTNICFKIVFSDKYFLNSSKFDIRHVKCLNVSNFLIKIEACSTLRNRFLHLINIRNFCNGQNRILHVTEWVYKELRD